MQTYTDPQRGAHGFPLAELLAERKKRQAAETRVQELEAQLAAKGAKVTALGEIAEPNQMKPLAEIAYHEAGHAVASIHAENSILFEVWIDEETGLGKTDRRNPTAFAELDPEARAKWANEEMIICCAGTAAQERFDPEHQGMVASDHINLEELISGMVGVTEQEREEQRQWAKQQANDFVSREWPAIERVAKALLQLKCLSGDEVKRLAGIE